MIKGQIYIAMLAALVAGAPVSGDTAEARSDEPMASSSDLAPGVRLAQVSMTDGTVVETMNSGGYTYVRVDTAEGEHWAAAPEVAVEVGDNVSMPRGAPMTNYHSSTLDRSFELIYFVPYLAVEGAVPGEGSGGAGDDDWAKKHMQRIEKREPAEIDVSSIEKVEGGKTVAEIFDEKSELSGQAVTIRGKVVKSTPNIMGKTWIHVKDGTTSASGADDLVVTTTDAAEVGSTILATGTVKLDVDLGFGYQFDVLIEEARITVE
jgi:hypothetical protein